MLDAGEAWFLLADGRRARLLVERVRGAALEERADWTVEIGPEDLYDPQDRPPRSYDSVGAGRHAMDGGRSLHEAEEEKFLARIAARIDEAAKHDQLEHLFVAAPPRALGILRDRLGKPAQARLRASAAKDLLDEDVQKLRKRLTDLMR
ncbi:MAG: host attachment protein [Hyphomonadaceae bacterium]|nr:host attachment protein [Hyphomonadaceae bacterium]